MMKEKLELCVLVLMLLGFASCQEIVILPKQDTLVKRVNEGLSLKCIVEQLTEGEEPNIQWFSVTGVHITATMGRIKVKSYGSKNSLNLIISTLKDGDEGQYTCKANVNGGPSEKNIEIQLYRGITIKGSPRLQRPNIYTDAFIECNADANPVPTVHWTFGNESPVPSGGRFVQQKDGLLIKNITEADNGIFYCLIEVGEMGDFKQYNITVQVTVPPKFDRPATSTDAIVGNNFEMTCSATGNPPPVFTFFKDDNPNPLDLPKFTVDKTNGKLSAEKMEETDSGMYKCIASNEAEGVRGTTTGGQQEQSLNILVKIPPKIVSVSEDKALMDARGELTCVAEGNPAPEVSWKKFGMNTVFTTDNTGETNSVVIENNEEELASGNKRVTSKLIFNKLKPTDSGAYTCTAINTAGTATANGTIIVEFKPNFDDTPHTTAYGWAGMATNITCRANGEPEAYIEWSRHGDKINDNSTYKIINTFGKGYVLSNLKTSVEIENENWIYGDYLCTATNGRGTSTMTIAYAKAERPGTALVSTDKTTPTSIEVLISPPGNDGGQPIKNYEIEYKLQGDSNEPKKLVVPKDNERTKARLEELQPDSVYKITVRAMNAVGPGAAQSLSEQTPKVRKPDPVTFNSKGLGDNPDYYAVSWDKPLTGGKPITGYKISYKQVEVNGDSESTWEVKRYLDTAIHKKAQNDVTSFRLERLVPNSFYEVEVIAVNSLGESEPRGKIFKTSKGASAVRDNHSPALSVSVSSITLAVIVSLACLIW